MNSKVWGPYIWYFIHKLCFYYLNHPDEYHQKKEILNHFFLFVGKILPCKNCQVSYLEFLKNDPPSKREEPSDLARWAVHLHNTINMKLNKPSLSYQDAYLLYHLSTCHHAKLFQALHCISQLVNDKQWLFFIKDIFPCLICRENIALLEVNGCLSWKEMGLSWMMAHLKDNITGFEMKHKSQVSLHIVDHQQVLLLHNPEKNKKAYVLRWLPVLPHTQYELVYQGKSPTKNVAVIYLVTKKNKLLPFKNQEAVLFSQFNCESRKAVFETGNDSVLQLRIYTPCVVEPSVLYSLSVHRLQT